MMPLALMAACTLLYTAAGQDTMLSMGERLKAFKAASTIEGQVMPIDLPRFHENIDELLKVLTEKPEKVDPLVLKIGPTCARLAGI